MRQVFMIDKKGILLQLFGAEGLVIDYYEGMLSLKVGTFFFLGVNDPFGNNGGKLQIKIDLSI